MTEAVDFSDLTPDLVMDATESLGLHCDARNIELNSYENRVYQIGIEDADPVVGKFYRPGRWTDEMIIEEHEFTLELADEDVPVVPPLIIEGRTLHHFGDHRFTLYPRRGGRAPPVDDLRCLEVLGRFIGRIHSVGLDKSYEHRPSLTVQDYGFASREYLLANDFIPRELVPAYESIADLLLQSITDRVDFDASKPIRLHGDCHMGNVLWRDDLPHFVDFDDSRMGPAMQDLWMLLSGDRAEREQQLASIVKGYKDFLPFRYHELGMIEALRTLRLMYHAAWIARRWQDPAFPRAFTFFNTERYWSEHILSLKEQLSNLDEPPLQVFD